jgi:hypothetical protein
VQNIRPFGGFSRNFAEAVLLRVRPERQRRRVGILRIEAQACALGPLQERGVCECLHSVVRPFDVLRIAATIVAR